MREHTPDADRRTVLKGTGAAVAGLALGSEITGATHGADGADERRPATIAHRGYAGLYPENTVEAAKHASRDGGADVVEVDVMPTADGDVVVFHDTRLSEREDGGLTDAEGVVWETDTATVRNAEVLDSGETIPTLDEAMAAIPASVGVNVEFKNPGSHDVRFGEKLSGADLDTAKERWRPFTERVFEVLERHENEVLVSSFYEGAIATTRAVSPETPVAFLFWDSIEEGLAITRKYDCEALHPPRNMIQGAPYFGDDYYLSGPFADVDLVSVAHEEGRAVNVWTIETWDQAERLAEAGVDGVITNYPDLLRNRP